MTLALVGALFTGIGAIATVLVLIHAFGRSVGTGFMVLCVPFYLLYYAFDQFEHRYKGLVIAGLFGGYPLGLALRAVAFGSFLAVR